MLFTHEICPICDEEGHRALACPWIDTECKNNGCNRIMMLFTFEEDNTFNKIYMKYQYQTYG